MSPVSISERRLAHLGSLLADRYEFLSLLGEGGSGAVYEVKNRSLDRLEALKVLAESFQDEQASARFAHEARVAASLSHPNIVRIHAFGQEDGIHWYSMQLVDGPALSELLEAGLRFDATMFARLAMPVLSALAFSHARGVIHRDIKPANILFDQSGQPFLADFGVAKTEENALQTRTGHLLGTPAYVAPEQALGDPVDARADQYSLGVTFYRALTGSLPFSADHVLQTLILRLQENPKPLQALRGDLDPRLGDILMRALARDREARWGSIAELRQALLEYCEAAGLAWEGPLEQVRTHPVARRPLPLPSAPPVAASLGSFEPTAEMPLPPRGRKGGPWPVLVGAVVLGAGGLAWWFAGHRPASPAPPAPSSAPRPAPVAAAPVVQTPAPVQASPRLQKPASETPVPPRLPAIYPQLIGTPLMPTAVSGCAGLRANVSLRIGEDGTVKACKVLSALPPACAEAARTLALQYRFKPALDAQGRPLETTIAAAVDFPEAP